MSKKKSCPFMGEPFAHDSKICIPHDHPEKCLTCKDGEWQEI